MDGPLVTIVTPSFNQAAFLEETIGSVLGQDYEPIEYIVVDAGSTDGSLAILDRYRDRLTHWVQEQDAGQAAAINFGFAHSSGEFMAFLNSDDTLLPGAVRRMVAELEGDPTLLLVYGDAVFVDERSRSVSRLPAGDFDLVEMVRRCENHVVQPSTLWRREAWELLGPLNEDGWYFFDFEFFLRFPPERVRHLPHELSTYRVHPGAKSAGRDGVELARDHARLAETFFAGERLPDSARSVAAEGQSRAYLLGAEFAYEALDLRCARRYVIEGFRRCPGHMLSRRWLSLLGKTFLPPGVVKSLRERRRSR